ncbi:MAG: SH3 domain-containing protein [Chloroflexi bacterium]|nr:MAG: SH3 domain-containing protein [Chloroflexota bacterium]
MEGNAFAPGQQLRIINLVLNVRTAPNANEPNVVSVLNFGDFVRVIAGPYPDPSGRYEWWEVATAQGITGWIAAVIDGRFTVEVVE